MLPKLLIKFYFVSFFLWVAVTKVNHKVISILIQTNMYSLYPLQTFDTLQAMLHSKKYFLTLRICEFIVFPKRMNSISKLHSITLHSSPSYNTILNFAVSIIKHTRASVKESKGYPPQKNFGSRLLPLRKGTLWQNIPPLLEKFEPKIQRVPPWPENFGKFLKFL